MSLTYWILVVSAMLGLQEQDDHWSGAIEALQAQDYTQALEHLILLPESARVLEKTGYCYYQMGQWKSAKEVYLHLLKQDSLHLQGHLYLGIIYNQEYDLPKAIKHYRTLVHLDSTNTYYIKSLAQVYERASLTNDALALFENVHKLNSQDISALLSLTNIQLDRKDYILADSFINLAFDLDTANIQVLLLKARCSYSLKNYVGCVDSFKKCQGRIDLNPFYQKMLGYSYLQIDSLDQAIHVLSNLLYQEQSEYTYSYLAKAHAEKKEWDRAIEFYEQSIHAGLSENLEQYHLALAKINSDHGHLKDALYHFDEAYQFSDDPSYLFYKAQAAETYYKDKQIALDQYRRYLRLAGDTGEYAPFAKDRISLLKEYLHQKR